MDPLSIAGTCVSLVGAITKTSILVTGFVRDVRAARSDLDAVSRELLSLKTVLELLADDVANTSSKAFPENLKKQVAGIVTNCSSVVTDIEETLTKHEGTGMKKAAQWVISGKDDMAKLRSSLEAHKSALEIALDMVAMSLTMEIKVDTHEIRNDTSEIKEIMKNDTTLILAEIARLQKQLPQDQLHNTGFMLQRYLDNLTSYAETVCDKFSEEIDTTTERRRSMESGIVPLSSPPSPILLDPGEQEEQRRQMDSALARSTEEYERSTVIDEFEPKKPDNEPPSPDAERLRDHKKEDACEEIESEILRKVKSDGNEQEAPTGEHKNEHEGNLELSEEQYQRRANLQTSQIQVVSKTSFSPSQAVRAAAIQFEPRPISPEHLDNTRRGKPDTDVASQLANICRPSVVIKPANKYETTANRDGHLANSSSSMGLVGTAINTKKSAAKSQDSHVIRTKSEPLPQTPRPELISGSQQRSPTTQSSLHSTRKLARVHSETNHNQASPWSWQRVQPEEVNELLETCTTQLKSNMLGNSDLLFLGQSAQINAARAFIQEFFSPRKLSGESLRRELSLLKPMAVASIVKWCWSRLEGGVIGWERYELFRIAESSPNTSPDSFLALFQHDNHRREARASIILDFFDLLLLTAVNDGMYKRRLPRLAGWWAFRPLRRNGRFESTYQDWKRAADASHQMFFAYLRRLNGIPARAKHSPSALRIAREMLIAATKHSPERPMTFHQRVPKVTMIVDSLSSDPFAQFRRANHFQYREDMIFPGLFNNEDPAETVEGVWLDAVKSISLQSIGCSDEGLAGEPGSQDRLEGAMSGRLLPIHEPNRDLEPAKSASVSHFDLDDSFWWVWICSFAGEETEQGRATFRGSVLIKTQRGEFIIFEEIVKDQDKHLPSLPAAKEKKSFWGRWKKTKADKMPSRD